MRLTGVQARLALHVWLGGCIACCPGLLSAQQAAARLQVRVTTSDGAAVIGAEITAGALLTAARSDSAGRLTIDAMPVGPVRLHVRALGYAAVDTTVMIQDGETTFVSLTMVPTA